MQELLVSTREALADASLHPLVVIGMFVVEFLAIHPFQDGNGRLSRVLTTLLLLQSGYGYVPLSSLESAVSYTHLDVYKRQLRVRATGDG